MQGHPERKGSSRFLDFWTDERSLTVMLLLMVLHFFILTPVSFLGHAVHVVGSLLFALGLLAGFLVLVHQRVLRWLGAVLIVGVVSFRAVLFVSDTYWPAIGDTLFTLLSLLAMVYVLYQQVAQEGPVSAHRIRGAIALYLLIAMLFAFLYGLAEEVSPGAFSMPGSGTGGTSVSARGEAFYYFSVVTLTTVGFGDITPIHPFVRSLAMLEALIGQLYPAILIARLVTLELETRREMK